MDSKQLTTFFLRDQPRGSDRARVGQIVRDTGKFNEEEVEIALELFDACLNQGADSGYLFLFADAPDSGTGGGDSFLAEPVPSNRASARSEEILGFACYGKISGTQSSFDLYWVAVDPMFQGLGIGKRLIQGVEQQVLAEGGGQIYVDTSGRPDYQPTRRFYASMGYSVVGELPDFYAEGDPKLIYCKKLL